MKTLVTLLTTSVLLTWAASACAVRLHMLNVGYGDCLLLEFPNDKTVLIDGGSLTHGSDVVSYLKDRGIAHIDVGVISHPHENHFGGFFALAREIRFDRIWVNGATRGDVGYELLLDVLEDAGSRIETVSRGHSHTLEDDWQLEILHPKNMKGGINDLALVLMLTSGKSETLIMTDAGTRSMPNLESQIDRLARADVIQIPHHGDRLLPSLTKRVTTAVDKIFLVSGGPNRFNSLPDDDFLNQMQGTVYRTDKHGVVVLEYKDSRWQRVH